MAASALMNNQSHSICSNPATDALKQEQQKLMSDREGRHTSLLEKELSLDLFSLNFEDDAVSFPAIEWDSGEESDSDSVRSLDCWNSILSKSDSMSSLGKRGRNDNVSRPLVRSKKIKSDLSTLALGLSF